MNTIASLLSLDPAGFAPRLADGKLDLNRITPDDMRCILEITRKILAWCAREDRTGRLAAVMHSDGGMIVSLDLAVVHLARGLNLRAMSRADITDLVSDYALISKNIRRDLAYFPPAVILRFAQSSRVIH
jgi:hypothetical protein